MLNTIILFSTNHQKKNIPQANLYKLSLKLEFYKD